jgi:hypothetical protein
MISSSFSRRPTALYYLAFGFVAMKFISFIVLNSGVTTHILEPLHVIRLVAWYAGKISPIAFCACFLLDARLRGMRRAVALWSVLLAAAITLTTIVMIRRSFA